VVSIDGHPMYHISPDYLPLKKLNEAGLTHTIAKGSPEAAQHAWKNTTKIDEFSHILSTACQIPTEGERVASLAGEVVDLDGPSLATLSDVALNSTRQRGAQFYGWINAPQYDAARQTFTHTTGWGESSLTRGIAAQEALDIYKQELDGAYGEECPGAPNAVGLPGEDLAWRMR
jgi:hypothetical protein